MTQMLFWAVARLLTVGMALGESVEHLRRASAGDPITIADYPYAVILVGTLDLDGVTHARHCSASIVAPHWLLTAAHCLYDQNDEGYRMDTFEAIVNSSIRAGAKGSQEVYGAQTFIAPGFDININKSRGDIALIKLKEPIVLGDNGGPPSAITLPKPAGWLRKSAVRHHIVKWTDYVTLDGPPGPTEGKLRQFDAFPTADESCIAEYPGIDPVSQYCLKATDRYGVVCRGHAGGASATYVSRGGRSFWVQLGVTINRDCPWGNRAPNSPLLTDVSQYCDFIEKTTGQELCVDVPELK